MSEFSVILEDVFVWEAGIYVKKEARQGNQIIIHTITCFASLFLLSGHHNHTIELQNTQFFSTANGKQYHKSRENEGEWIVESIIQLSKMARSSTVLWKQVWTTLKKYHGF